MIESVAPPEVPVVTAGTNGVPVASPPLLPFAPEEQAGLQAEDRQAALMVVSIMTAIFTLGLIGYTMVCFVAAGGR